MRVYIRVYVCVFVCMRVYVCVYIRVRVYRVYFILHNTRKRVVKDTRRARLIYELMVSTYGAATYKTSIY